MNPFYKVDKQLHVLPDTNELLFIEENRVVKIEPRVMSVLCMLLKKPNRVIERRVLVKEIWGNYGGGDEGLTQAISQLRKTLNSGTDDKEKTMIETITKTGYRINAKVEKVITNSLVPNMTKRFLMAAIIVIVLIILTGVYFAFDTRTSDIGNASIMASVANLA